MCTVPAHSAGSGGSDPIRADTVPTPQGRPWASESQLAEHLSQDGGPLVLDEGLSCWLSTALCIVPAHSAGSVGSDPTQSDAGPLRQGRLQHAWSMSRGIKP